MGFLSGLMGNASQVDVEQLSEELSPILANNETVELGFKLIRDQFIFTNKRLINKELLVVKLSIIQFRTKRSLILK